MTEETPHTFHIPVMGLGYTIDAPLKVARFGISSVVSIIEDHLVEQMREFHCLEEGEPYIPIKKTEKDRRALRITAYLNLLNKIVKKQVAEMKEQAFEPGTDIVKYFEMLPPSSTERALFEKMQQMEEGQAKQEIEAELRNAIVPGSIDVNIMTKCNRTNYDKNGEPLPMEYADALAALRGYAKSDLASSIVFSAGFNPHLYSYCEAFEDFFPDKNGKIKKKIVLKVSDYRSAIIQGRFLAKKGLWVSEFRIESGLNCGGHAFATDGMLMGPILEEFKAKRDELSQELFEACNKGLDAKEHALFQEIPEIKITVQGGIGTANENQFLMDHYEVDGTGWGSPFLLVPEVTNVDRETLDNLSVAKKEDYYLSYSSPLGILFNNFRKSSSDTQRRERIEKGRPGSPCPKKFLAFNTEFATEKKKEPICTASREYQHLKIKELDKENLSPQEYLQKLERITVKDCLCEGLGAAALVKNDFTKPKQLKAVAICPGPNLAYFSGKFTLQQMVDHIYGRINALNQLERPNMFINELMLYVDHLKHEIETASDSLSDKVVKFLSGFKANLFDGIEYYKNLIPTMSLETESYLESMQSMLSRIADSLSNLEVPEFVSVG